MFYLEVGIVSVMIVITVVELIRAVIWEIEDFFNNKGKGGEEDDVCGDDR